jgi:glutamate--cysteine ligase
MPKITEILLQKITAFEPQIEAWFGKKFQENPALFYNSVDLRHDSFKIAPVDTNCFPAGFNNLSEVSKDLAKKTVDDFLSKNFPQVKKILIIPENHTQNIRYLENLRNLQEILADKRQVMIGSLIEDLKEPLKIDLESDGSITLNPLTRNEQKITTLSGFSPDLIVLNNDLTPGVAQVLQNLKTDIIPSSAMGWYRRTKSQHFTIYNELAAELCALINLDPWLISSFHDSCHDLDFKEQIGLEFLAKAVDELLAKVAQKYQQYGISEAPYCYIKADNGTYGIAVWSVSSGAEVLEINKKERNKMNTLKGSVHNTSAMIQEGIRTLDKINCEIAEPMIYLINGQVVGNLFRVNNSRDERISLNATGSSFFDLNNLNENQIDLGADKDSMIKIYALIARLAALASAVENKVAVAAN